MKRLGRFTAMGCCVSIWSLAIPHSPAGELSLSSLDPTRMVRDVETLSSVEFSGRQSGSGGGLASAVFVAQRFHHLGLTPAGMVGVGRPEEPWSQPFPGTLTHIESPTTLEFSTITSTDNHGLVPQTGKGFLPVLDSPSVNVTAPVVFVGYGISDPAHGRDEYDGVDVRNRVVMFLRDKPSHYPKPIHHAEKERIAREKGAVAFVTLTGPVLSPYAVRRGMGFQALAFYSNAANERPLPGAWINGETGEALFKAEGLDLKQIQETLNETPAIQSRNLKTIVRMRWESAYEPGLCMNVLGIIPGNHPQLKEETVILGAHRDHFGEQAGLIFPGADDNASGTALMLEVARVLRNGKPAKRAILFASFSGEEQNLLGSSWYVRHPARPLVKTIAMINVDHVGVGNGRLTVGLSKVAKEAAKQAANTAELSDTVQLYGFFPGGDHVPFAEANIPTIAVVTAGTHPHFHRASDSADTIQPEILHTAAQFVLSLTHQLANGE